MTSDYVNVFSFVKLVLEQQGGDGGILYLPKLYW